MVLCWTSVSCHLLDLNGCVVDHIRKPSLIEVGGGDVVKRVFCHLLRSSMAFPFHVLAGCEKRYTAVVGLQRCNTIGWVWCFRG